MRATKAQRQRIKGLSAATIKAQRAAVEAIAAELERRRQKEPPFEWDDRVLAEIATMPLPEFEPLDLSGLFEPLDLSDLFEEDSDPPGTPGRPVFIPISDD